MGHGQDSASIALLNCQCRNRPLFTQTFRYPPRVSFCNGPWCQVSRFCPAAGYLLLSVVRSSCHIIRSEEAVSLSLGRRPWRRLLTFRLHHLHRPSGGTTGRSCGRPGLLEPPRHAIAIVSLLQRKSVPSTHIRWWMTPSLRARATRAFLVPRRFATPIAQLLSEDMRTVRVSITLAAS